VDCTEYIAKFLGADADGELSGAEAQAVSQHLATCPACADRLASERALKAFLRQRISIVSTPAAVRRQIIDELDRSERSRLADWVRALAPAMRWAPAAIAAVLVVIVLFARFSRTPEVPAFDQAVASYAAFQNQFVPTVSADSGAALGPQYNEWISKQIGMPLSAWNFDKLGYRFVGGRLSRLPDGRPVVYTMYSGADGKIVCAFQRSADFPVPPGGQTVNNVSHFYRYKGMSVCLTVAGDMVCILTCKMPLDDFIRTIKQVES